jgi:glycosyltransferase involved in cell wall biosynthesis
LRRKPLDVAVLAPLPSPYYIPAWNELSRRVGGNCAVCFLSLTNSLRRWRLPEEQMEFDWRALSQANSHGFIVQLRAASVWTGFLLSRRPRAVICSGYDSLAAWTALAWCKLFRRRLVLWCESNARDVRSKSRVRTLLKRIFVSRCDAVAALGRAASAYAKQLGAREEGIFLAPFGGDNRHFAREAQKVDAAAEKGRRGWPPRLILFAGRLLKGKGVFVLLEAFRRIGRDHPDVGLLFAGHGSEEAEMQEFCRDAGLDRVYFVGAQQYEDMPYFYALADLLVLPTFSDPYGYVVVEALACGVPAIVSNVAGVCDDFISDGETGFAVPRGDTAELARRIAQVLDDQELRARMSANCRHIVEGYSPEACAEGLLAASTGRAPTGWAGFGTDGTGSP